MLSPRQPLQRLLKTACVGYGVDLKELRRVADIILFCGDIVLAVDLEEIVHHGTAVTGLLHLPEMSALMNYSLCCNGGIVLASGGI